MNETMLDQDKFKGQAVMTATNTLGGVFGSLFGGFLIDNAGVGAMNTVCFAMAAAGAVLVFLGLQEDMSNSCKQCILVQI